MTGEDDDFDFESWRVASSLPRPSFESSVRAALKQLALKDGKLRSRLHGALFCLLYTDETTIPPDLRPAYDEIAQYVTQRAGEELDSERFFRFVRDMKIKTARRLAGQIFRLHEQVFGGRPT